MAIYLGNTPIAENVTIQQGGGVTIDDTLSDTSKNPVQNKVINAALNSKANLSDIPDKLPADGGNADTVDGKHADDFVPMYNHLDDSFDITNATEYGIYRIRGGRNLPTANYYMVIVCNVGGYTTQIAISDNNALYKRHYNNNTKVWTDWSEFATKADIPDSLPANGGNADTVNGRRAYRIPTLNENANPFDANAENINDAYLQWDGSTYFKLKTFGKNLTAVDYATNAATVNGLAVQTAVPANAKFTDTKVTAVGNHYTPSGGTTTSASGGSLTDITNSSSGVQVVTGVTKDAAGHVTGVTSVALKSTNTDTTYGAASTSANGLMTTGAQTLAGNKTFNGQVIPAGASAVGTAQARKIYAGTSDMTAGTTALETGTIYLVYE